MTVTYNKHIPQLSTVAKFNGFKDLTLLTNQEVNNKLFLFLAERL